MFSRAAAIFILFALMLTNFSRLFIYGSFELNRKYIATELCENRDKPELQCNGKCYLSKKLKQAEEREKKEEHDTQKKSFQDNYILKQNSLTQLFSIELKKDNSIEITGELPTRTSEVLHPPPPSFQFFS